MTGKTTRQSQADFEQSLRHALLNKDVIKEIAEILIGSIIDKLRDKFVYYDDKINRLETEILELKNIIEQKDTKNVDISAQKQLQEKVDNIQQQTKINNLRLVGFKEQSDEHLMDNVVKLLNEKMNCNINSHDIVSVYRTGTIRNDKPRHVVIKFCDNACKMKIYNNKKSLKGTGLVLKEDLIHSRVLMVQKASDKYGFKNVWTINGIIFAKTNNGVQKIRN